METVVKKQGNSQLLAGIQGGASIAIGYFPIAMTFGLLAKTTGLSGFETMMMSILVFAGASQFMSLNMMALAATGIEIVLATFVVNIRHLLMSASLNEKIDKAPHWQKAFLSFGITDETFTVMSTKEGKMSSAYGFGVILISYGSWVICSGIGYGVGSYLPQVLQESMAIALYAMFVGLLVPSMKRSVKVFFLAGVGGVLNSVFVLANISTGWAILFATVLSVVCVELVDLMKQKGEE
ncbi:AzlC family ABC transporter permease [Bacillus sp. 2205SS5-2]|uniref:AzlC family ABC transporter permease n=1 Tax=Bacillus sp. 2205SS5-2 TaxID=3109031 RepID=UPI003004F54C